MAKEDIPMWVKVAIAVILFAVTIATTAGGVAWAMGRDSATQGYVVDSLLKTDIRHDQLILKNANGLSLVKEDLHEAEKARLKLDGKIEVFIVGQQATTKEITEMKNEFTDFKDYLMQFDYDKKKETK